MIFRTIDKETEKKKVHFFSGESRRPGKLGLYRLLHTKCSLTAIGSLVYIDSPLCLYWNRATFLQ